MSRSNSDKFSSDKKFSPDLISGTVKHETTGVFKQESSGDSLLQLDEGQQPIDDYFQQSTESALISDPSMNANDGLYLDFDLDADGEDQLDFDFAGQLSSDFPGEASQYDSGDLHDKRKSAQDQNEHEEGGKKRRENDGASAKKPGRKPVAAEPTTKRKAQNRAAQRAFRERKEKHLKDLETKVEDLEKASETANNENSVLRTHVEQLQIELKQYRKRMSMISNSGGDGSPPRSSSAPGSAAKTSRSTDNDFHFDFPPFGDLTTDTTLNNANPGSTSMPTSARSAEVPAPVSDYATTGGVGRESANASPPDGSNWVPGGAMGQIVPSDNKSQHLESFDLLNPAMSRESHHDWSYFTPTTSETYQPAQQPHTAKPPQQHNDRQPSHSSSANTNSPDSSLDSHPNTSSICTSPDLSLSSPGQKVTDIGLNSIREEVQTPSAIGGSDGTSTLMTPVSFNWLVQQNAGAFDQVLFKDYREPQDTFASQDFGAYFDSAFPLPELGSPEHTFQEAAPGSLKKNLIDQVEAAQDGTEEVVPQPTEIIPCKKMWDRLQSMEKVRNGEIDIESLCKEMKAKAQCSEGGPALAQAEFEKIIGSSA